MPDDKKNINLLPEDLRDKKIKISKIKIKESFDLTKPKDTEKIQENKIEPKKTPPPMPETAEKEIVVQPIEKSIELKKETSKGVFTIKKTKPSIFLQLKSILFNKFLKENLLDKKIKKKSFFSLDINLISEDAEIFRMREKKLFRLLYLELIVSLLIVLIIYSYLSFSQWRVGDEGEKLKGKIIEVESQIFDFKRNNSNLINIQKKALSIKGLLEKHVYWTKFFSILEKYTLPNVYYVSFSSAIDAPLTLNGFAINSQTLVQQIITLQNATDFINKIEISDIKLASKDSEEVSFRLDLSLEPNVFLIND